MRDVVESKTYFKYNGNNGRIPVSGGKNVLFK